MLDFDSFIFESKQGGILNHILDSLDDTIHSMMDKIIKTLNRNAEVNDYRKPTEFDKEIIRLDLIMDLIKSIEIYTLPTDKLVELKNNTSIKGNIEIYAVIERGGQEYFLETIAIYAGGHNIQRLHYRYITKTNLPKTGQNILYNDYKEKKKKLKKTEKFQNEIHNYEKRIERLKGEIETNKKVTDEEILNDKDKKADSWRIFRGVTWEDIKKKRSNKKL